MPEVREFDEVLFPIGDNKYITIRFPKDMTWDEWQRASSYISQKLADRGQPKTEPRPEQPHPVSVHNLKGL